MKIYSTAVTVLLGVHGLSMSIGTVSAWIPSSLMTRPVSTRVAVAKDQDIGIPSIDLDNDSAKASTTPVEIDQIKLSPPTRNMAEKWRRKDLFGSSIVDQTLQGLESDKEFQQTRKQLATIGLEGMTKEERTKRRRALTNLGIPNFDQFLSQNLGTTTTTTTADDGTHTSTDTTHQPFQLKRVPTKILQINIGLYCNQACGHCHVESSPLRKEENMSAETAARCLELLQQSPAITTLDITGGAPELNPNFRYLVRMARELRPDLEIIDRCNLTVLQEPGQEDLIDFLRDNRVHIVASLPCYSEENVDSQRGSGVFERSIAALLALNDAGYGMDPSLQLDLVYNPLGAFLPPPQSKLEDQYKTRLEENFGVLFNHLLTITNMPIKRFADFLHRRGELEDYMSLLVRNFNKDTVQKLMCLDTVSVGWDGQIYDCDFNQQLGMGLAVTGGRTIFDIESVDDLMNIRVRTDNHCFGCTAGMGSSCQGAMV